MPIETSFTGINSTFRLIKILFIFTVILLPVTLCYSIRPIWFNTPPGLPSPPPPSPSSPSSLSSSPSTLYPAESTNVDSVPFNEYIQTAKLLDAIAVNDLSSLDNDFDPTSEVDVNRNNLILQPSTSLDGSSFSKDVHLKPSFNLNKGSKQSKTENNPSNRVSPALLTWIEPDLMTTNDDTNGKRMFKRGSVSRVKKALSLFAHWKPSYKQHLDDGYSSELVSAVSRGHGRTAGQALRWG